MARAMNALQLKGDILQLVKGDILGRMVQDMEIKTKKRASKK